MFRYIAFVRLDDSSAARHVFRRASEQATELHNDFSLAYQTDTACLLYTDSTPGRMRIHRLGQNGAVIGTLFRSVGGAPVSTLSGIEIEEIAASKGNVLVQRHWGQYIAFMRMMGGAWRVLRDPTGGLPCYCVRSLEMAIVFSHLTDCASLLPIKLSVNYPHLHTFLGLNRIVSSDTGFNEIAVLHAGEAFDFRGRALTRAALWEPSLFCGSPGKHESTEQSIAEIREVATGCVGSWAQCRRSILHELSGGLDSSIVLACLASATSMPRLACCTHVTDSPEGDERYYAHLMARHARVPLVEVPLRAKAWTRIEDLIRVRDPISPLLTAFQCSEDSEIRGLLEARSFDCTFSGQGGDHLFLRTLPSITAADYAWVHGLHPRLLRVIIETAHASRQPIWNIARQAFVYGYRRRRYDIWSGLRAPSFIRTPPVDISRSCHPWLADGEQLPPAKLLQVMCLTETQTYWATPRPYVDEIHPLISQPLLECCLRIPTYVLSHGGTDRSIARAAFQDALPPEIAQRSSKGAVTRYFFQAVYGNREHIRSFLLDGLLADRGLLDRSELEKVLGDPLTIARGRSLIPIMTAAVCEMWLRSATRLVQSTGSLSTKQQRRYAPGTAPALSCCSPEPEGTLDRGGTSRRASVASGNTGPPSPGQDPHSPATRT